MSFGLHLSYPDPITRSQNFPRDLGQRQSGASHSGGPFNGSRQRDAQLGQYGRSYGGGVLPGQRLRLLGACGHQSRRKAGSDGRCKPGEIGCHAYCAERCTAGRSLDVSAAMTTIEGPPMLRESVDPIWVDWAARAFCTGPAHRVKGLVFS